MDVLQRIDELRKGRGWSYYKLAEESGVTQSTIANMFARKSNPSIPTLGLFCNAFGITLAEFFCSTDIPTDDELLLITKYRSLPEADKATVKALVKHLSSK